MITLKDVMLHYCEESFWVLESEENARLFKLLSEDTYPGLIRLSTSRGVIAFNLSSHVPFWVEVPQ